MMKNKNHNLDILSKNGIKKTPGRISIIQILEKSSKPISSTEINSKLKSKIDKVTIYRTLELFEKNGLVRRVDTLEREAKYELNHKDDHHHLICTNCKKVVDFTGCDADKLIDRALKQTGGFQSVSHHTFDIFGLCRTCAR